MGGTSASRGDMDICLSVYVTLGLNVYFDLGSRLCVLYEASRLAIIIFSLHG